MNYGRFDEQLKSSLVRIEALRKAENLAWSEVKSSEIAMRLIMDKWEDSCSAIRRELDHQQAMEFLLQLEANQTEATCSKIG